ncbi:MAG TPA: 50S ribosomal protein L10 [Patescibacteria group bacterium]|nr:50S ribosomal protein L10 [Patescibacteria group bacterium]
MPHISKIQKVDKLAETIKNAQHIVLVQFGSTSHQKFETLRKALKSAVKTEKKPLLQVVKNSLFKKAAQKAHKGTLADDRVLVGTTAILTIPAGPIDKPDSWEGVLPVFYRAATEENQLAFKIGIIDGVVYRADQLAQLAQLPSREELYAKLVGFLYAPQRRTVTALRYGMMKLVRVLQAKSSVTN